MQTLIDTLRENKWIVLDTETTGLGSSDEVVQIGILSSSGLIVMDELVKPTRPIPIEAQYIHGITDQMVSDKRTIIKLEPRLRAALEENIIVAYNVDFDFRMLYQSFEQHNIDAEWLENLVWLDVMKPYARFHGGKRGRWQSLTNACYQQNIAVSEAHSAIEDCRLTLKLLKKFGV